MNAELIETIMEKTVIPSFSSLGPGIRRRLHHWRPLESWNLQDKVVVLTGATSGIGRAAASLYAQLGATLVIVARDADKAQSMIETLQRETGNRQIELVCGDLGVRDDVLAITAELERRLPRIDVLAHNAGALFNERRRASNGTDLTVELMVVTPFLMTGRLLNLLTNNTVGRVLTMSSGGMYTQGLTVDGLEMPDEHYQGAKQYALAKRAQVILNELWAEHIPSADTVFHAMHPGWVDTPGITDALPGFARVLGPMGLLRKPREGADTLVWLSVADAALECTGQFWHDRAIRTIDFSNRTRKDDTPERRKALWAWCQSQSGWCIDT